MRTKDEADAITVSAAVSSILQFIQKGGAEGGRGVRNKYIRKNGVC